eukprot:CAMPEP_0177560236 /NCGR_PEP_ID=MMETSP0369-20130122/71268_1 /TAXON_ID=447022 ORGANISM="Scrippsiella hangoei-like, Strain SHHI-4" /NCGR_SAMPLE_ID=MMETSP0369 /ASSEMBLY_ACC=CAM_ASM_000364 /LENGTH=258 /DNA_ID=CAMNT_0019047031 /DNA_START=44 /DNA_END=824 /DNA_ORIENTATION=+
MTGTLLGSIVDEAARAWAKLAGYQVEDNKMNVPYHPRVYLVATPFGPGLPNLQAYHTSVVVDQMEYSFCPFGVVLGHGPESHRAFDFAKNMRELFMRGSYDLLGKNCNSFSDVALSYLVGKRLESKFSQMEQIGASADKYSALVRLGSGGAYRPNPAAEGFCAAEAIVALEREIRWEACVERPHQAAGIWRFGGMGARSSWLKTCVERPHQVHSPLVTQGCRAWELLGESIDASEEMMKHEFHSWLHASDDKRLSSAS